MKILAISNLRSTVLLLAATLAIAVMMAVVAAPQAQAATETETSTITISQCINGSCTTFVGDGNSGFNSVTSVQSSSGPFGGTSLSSFFGGLNFGF